MRGTLAPMVRRLRDASSAHSGSLSDDSESDKEDTMGSDLSEDLELWRQLAVERNTWLKEQIDMVRHDLQTFNTQGNFDCSLNVKELGLSLTFEDVAFEVQVHSGEDTGQKIIPILESCCGHFPAGSLVALMGPSGCGKTTLLDILAKKKNMPHSGNVYLNGTEADCLFHRVAAYVDNSDTMPQHWTVREAVKFDFFLKGQVPVFRHFEKELVRELVDFHLELVGLTHVAESKIGGGAVRGISSGQRRRVTLARGMAAGVPLMFCDEPTSGLSSTDAEMCMKVLKILTCKWKKTIVVVIHQPRIEVAHLFDRLLLLTARPGRVVYDGPMADAREYWESVGRPVPLDGNPTDHFLDTITPDAPGASPDFFAEQYRERQLPRISKEVGEALQERGPDALAFLEAERMHLETFGRMPRVRRSVYSVNIFRQIEMVGGRKIKLMLVDPVVLAMQIFVPLFEGIGLGFCFYGIGTREPKGIMVVAQFLNMVLMAVLFGGFTGVPQLIDDREVMQKECSEALYMEASHIMVAMLVDMLQTLVRNTLFITIMYAFALLPWSRFGLFYAWTLLLGITMDPIFKAAAAIAKDMQTATMGGLIFVLFIAVFNGIGFVTKAAAPTVLRPLLYASPSARVAERIAFELYGDDHETWNNLHAFLGLEDLSPWVALGICFACFGIFNVIAGFALVMIKQIQK